MRVKSDPLLPLISVVVCTYNGSQYLVSQLESILNQTYKKIEIIICDDNSSDHTLEIIRRYADKHPNIHYYTNKKNIGFNRNFEKAIRIATGEYIAVSDQDDIWSPLKLIKLLTHINDKWLIFSNSAFIDNRDMITGRKLLESMDVEGKSYRSILLANFVTGHTTLFHRIFLKFCLPFPPVKYYDWWMGFVAIYHNKITYLDEILTYYRIHSSSVIQQQVSNTDETHQANVEYKTVCNQLRYFQRYAYLTDKDRNFIKSVRKAYIKKGSRRSLSLLRMMLLNGNQLTPPNNFKKRNNLISALHYSKGVQSN